MNAESTNDDYLKAAKEIQDKTADAYKGALDLVNATKDVSERRPTWGGCKR